jgi:hypothetical protein
MRHRTRSLSLIALVVFGAGCAAQGGSTDPGPHPDHNLLTAEQLNSQSYNNAYEAVEALRTNWLKPHGVDSFTSPSVVIVYLDDNKLGGVDYLRGISLYGIQSIRHLDAREASARWGLGHASGVIQVTTAMTGGTASAPNDR